jgi:hypothetical protein
MTTTSARVLTAYELASIAEGFPWECACGEHLRTYEAAINCRKCYKYVVDYEDREEPVDLRKFLP